MERPDPLLLGLSAGNERAFGVLYDRYAGRLYGAALGMLGRREDAEDAVQEVFVAVVRSRRKLLDVRDLTAYLFTALRHAAARVAARRARQPVAIEWTTAQVAADRPRSSIPHGEQLEQALQTLPPPQREVITLKIDGQLTFAQIGQVLEISPNTAASRYRYALEKLRLALKGGP